MVIAVAPIYVLVPLSVAEPPLLTKTPPDPEMTPARPSGTELESMMRGDAVVVVILVSVTKLGVYPTA